MENKKEKCNKLFKRWKELNGKIFSNDYSSYVKFPPPSSEESKEFFTIKEKLKNECLDCLTTRQKIEIGEYFKAE